MNFFNIKKLKSIFLPIVAAALIGGGIAYFLGSTVLQRYESQGLLNAELSLSEYKRISENLAVPTSAKEKLAIVPSKTLDESDLLSVSGTGGAKWHSPVARVTKADTKELPEEVLKFESDPSRPYAGIRINVRTDDPQRSAAVVSWLGEYFRDAAVKELLRTEIFNGVASNRIFLIRAQEDRVRLVFELEESGVRLKALHDVMKQYPELAKIGNRPLAEAGKEDEKPIFAGGQIIAAEVEMINLKQKQARLERQVLQSEFIAPYLSSAEKLSAVSKSGSELTYKLDQLANSVMQTVQTEAQREAILTKATKAAEISARFFARSQFIVPPSISNTQVSPRPVIFALLGAILFSLLALIWLLRNRIITFFKSGELDTKHA